jgi:hypothetical protein
MGADDDEQQRQLRAEARRARMTVVRTRRGMSQQSQARSASKA